MPTTELPLDGVRVLEVSGGVPAGFATRLLAGFGADVVRIDGYETGPPLNEDDAIYLLAGKRRVTGADLDLAALARAADIVVEDGPPGHLASLGAAPVDLRQAKPELVIVSITPFGQTGPYRDWQATNIVSFAMGGIMSLTGDIEQEPLMSGGGQAQYFGALHAFAAAATAHVGAVLHGEGDWLDISLMECAAGTLELYAPWTAFGAVVQKRMGNHTRAEWGIYPCVDGWAGMFALQRQVKALFEAVGDPELLEGPFMDPMYRLEHNEELIARLYGFTLQYTKAELMAIGRERRVPIGVATTPSDLLSSPGLEARGFWDAVDTGSATARVPGRPFTGLGWRTLDRVHEPGEDTATVVKEWLEGGAS